MASAVEGYESRIPSPQTALDLFHGEWTSTVPVDGISGTDAVLFADGRITWLIDEVGPLAGKRVLELGPLEAAHTTMLERAGAQVTAVEANRRAYLRCLVVKELLDLRARFVLGDATGFLEAATERWDVIVASGILYHMTEPLRLLRAITTHADAVLLWTHYHDAVSLVGDARFGPPLRQELDGFTCEVVPHGYGTAREVASFCGGPEASSVWMRRGDLTGALEHWGFGRFRIAFDHPDHPNGPAVAIIAQRQIGMDDPR